MVEISRMRALIARRGAAAAQRILAPDEMAEYLASHDPARLLAKRFAVKEALAKALGTGLRAPVLLTSISLTHDALGKPQLSLSDDLSRLLATRGITHPHVSISDERLYALAFVVLEGPLPPHLSEIT
jgi:holo-[acyl-carrier protein] synthase